MPLCECGCGVDTRPGTRFVLGHNQRKSDYHERPKEQAPCACGCGILARVGSKFIRGHQNRTPERRKRFSEFASSPEQVERRIIHGKTEEVRNARSTTMKRLREDPEFVKKQVEGASKAMTELNKDPEFAALNSAQTTERWKTDPSFVESQRHKLFKQAPESQRQLFELLQNLGFTIQYEYIIGFENGRRFYDFFFTNLNTLVEIDGDYWHDKVNDPANEKLKTELAKINGFKLIRVPYDSSHHRMAEVLLPQLPDVI
jgi:very-short-patch-repair endonuclease